MITETELIFVVADGSTPSLWIRAEQKVEFLKANGQAVELLSILVNAGIQVPTELTRSVREAEEAHICEVHQIPMVRVEGKRGPFWSCHQRNADGRFCNLGPTFRPEN